MPRIRPQDSTKRPGLSWASGKEIIGQDRIHKGLFIDTGLDDALDAAAAAAGWPVGDLSHMGGVTREHWFLPADAQLFVLIDGVPFTKMAALVKNDVSYAGVGARWPQGGKSALGVQMLIADLVGQGYLTPLIFTVSGTSTDDLLNALLAHDAVLSACSVCGRGQRQAAHVRVLGGGPGAEGRRQGGAWLDTDLDDQPDPVWPPEQPQCGLPARPAGTEGRGRRGARAPGRDLRVGR